mmetsp:Transcript_33537/g.44231  ORF Transcript_33537/g.44231 Transcript_33537/m.44231 type:complete len:128 (+) Transcript_33537:68-451(+)
MLNFDEIHVCRYAAFVGGDLSHALIGHEFAENIRSGEHAFNFGSHHKATLACSGGSAASARDIDAWDFAGVCALVAFWALDVNWLNKHELRVRDQCHLLYNRQQCIVVFIEQNSALDAFNPTNELIN